MISESAGDQKPSGATPDPVATPAPKPKPIPTPVSKPKPGATPVSYARPPQFVMLAFDNCDNLSTWSQVSAYLTDMNSIQKDRLRFTFFLSGVGLITDAAKSKYETPDGRHGASKIGFGGSQADVLKRIGFINKLARDGNEIASHAVGHFDGTDWTSEQWLHEIAQYNTILTNLSDIDGFTGSQRQQAQLAFLPKDMKGFRAPYLAGGSKLISALDTSGYVYDTSDTNQGWEPTTWPQRYTVNHRPGPWNFGLSFVTAKGIPGKLPAMNYNFCFHQDDECPESYPASTRHADEDAKIMLDSYVDAFVTNYNGNRAPIHIGHHFEQYRGGAYQRALFNFAKKVCGLKEVKCVTYKELAAYMSALPAGGRDQLQRGNFPKAASITRSEIESQPE